MSWNSLLWGIEFKSAHGKPVIIGSLWHGEFMAKRTYYDEEPTRALLFQTRKAAREWCAAEHAKYANRNDCCADWRFRPVRVRETVRKA